MIKYEIFWLRNNITKPFNSLFPFWILTSAFAKLPKWYFNKKLPTSILGPFDNFAKIYFKNRKFLKTNFYFGQYFVWE